MKWRIDTIRARIVAHFSVLLLIICISHSVLSQSGIIVINPGDKHISPQLKDWLFPFGEKYLYDWGRTRGFVLQEDLNPVVDHVAAFVAPHGSRLTVNGLRRGVHYWIWIDFVRFKGIDTVQPSVMTITFSSEQVDSRFVQKIRTSDIGSRYISLPLPMEITVTGNIEIEFQEISKNPGTWGVWDIILTDNDTLPAILLPKKSKTSIK